MKKYINLRDMSPSEVTFTLGQDRQGKPSIHAHYGENAGEVAMVSPACVTNWPRISGDGNYGTMWGPTDISKAKFTLDLTDAAINEQPNPTFTDFDTILTTIDERLLDFVQANQLKILGRKNLTRDEIKMLQIRSVRPKYDKISGNHVGSTVQMSASKYAWDGMGGKYAREIAVCDKDGAVVPGGTVQPGDVVAATIFINQVYTGVGGDKFGIHWSFEDVQVVCQRARLAQKTQVSAFSDQYDFAMPYTTYSAPETMDYNAQFSEPMAVGS